MNGALKALSICFKSLMSKVKQAKTTTGKTENTIVGFKSLMSKVKRSKENTIVDTTNAKAFQISNE